MCCASTRECHGRVRRHHEDSDPRILQARRRPEMQDEVHGWEAAYRKRPSGEKRPHQDAEFLDGFFRCHGVRRILDLGCGDGRHIIYFAKRGYAMYGLDVAATAISLTEEWLGKEGMSAELVACDMSAIPWPDDFFDATVCVQVIDHHRIEEIRKTVGEIYRTLRPGGYLFLTVGTNRPKNPAKFGFSVEVGWNTYVRTEGHEKGVPHHFFDEEELLDELSAFDILRDVLSPHKDSRGKRCFLFQKPCR